MVYILNMDSEKFSLGGTITVCLKAGAAITDVCYVKTADGTPCLLLSFHGIMLLHAWKWLRGSAVARKKTTDG